MAVENRFVLEKYNQLFGYILIISTF